MDANVVTKIILAPSMHMQPGLVDVLGLHFGIEPLFFWSSICSLGGLPGSKLKYPLPPMPLKPRFLRFGNHHAKVLKELPEGGRKITIGKLTPSLPMN